MHYHYCAPKKHLMQIKDVDEELAVKIQKVWLASSKEEVLANATGKAVSRVNSLVSECFFFPGLRRIKREAIAAMLESWGVHYIGTEKRTRDPVYACEAGDTYSTTIVFKGHRMLVTTVGDIVERNQLVKDERIPWLPRDSTSSSGYATA